MGPRSSRRTSAAALLAGLALPTLAMSCRGVLGITDSGEVLEGGAADGDAASSGAADGASAGPSDGAANDAGAAAGKDAGGVTDAGPDAAGTYAAAQAALASKRFPGPLTAQGAKGYCTNGRLVWRDLDGTTHSWAASDHTRIDYGWKPPTPTLFPSDGYATFMTSGPLATAVYDMTATQSLVASLPYAYSSAATVDGALLMDQTGSGANLVTNVRKWVAATATTTDVVTGIPTAQHLASYGLDEVVIPGNGAIPYPLYIVDVPGKSTGSVTFDGAISMYQALPTSLGLVVSYARSGPIPEIRLYQGNLDNAGSRVEIGDELAAMPGLFSDSPLLEHKFMAFLARDGKNILYASGFGIFGYTLDTGALAAVQLGPGKTALIPDIMCVIEDARLLVYRIQGDATGQVWAVPLAGILP